MELDGDSSLIDHVLLIVFGARMPRDLLLVELNYELRPLDIDDLGNSV